MIGQTHIPTDHCLRLCGRETLLAIARRHLPGWTFLLMLSRSRARIIDELRQKRAEVAR